METIELSKIICESNRKYTKDEGFEQLLNSIQQYGIIQPPTVRKMDDGMYKVVAGRRRIEAARQLKHMDSHFADIECVILEAEDPVDDDEIALTENVNRQEMHPLDEAGAVKRMADAGTPIEEIARYYARSPSAIYKRLRLSALIDELKNWFRDGIINISGAVVLAELPEKDQKEFFKQNEERYGDAVPEDDEDGIIERREIEQFIYKTQHYKIKSCMKDECQACNKRTHNEDNELFEEFDYMNDVCLDADCYRIKWYEMITRALQEQYQVSDPTEQKIYFRETPELLYKKANRARFTIGKESIEFEILRTKDYVFTGETKRKKNTCWYIGENYEGRLIVQRWAYEEKIQPNKTTEKTDSASKNISSKEIKEYCEEAIEAISAACGKTPGEIVKLFKSKNLYSYNFKNNIGNIVYERVITERIKKEKCMLKVPDYLKMFLKLVDDEGFSYQTFTEKNFSKESKQRYKDIVGEKSIADISVGLLDDAQRLFHFLLLQIGIDREVPNLDELKTIENKDNIFWRYANMSKDEYKALYLEAAKEAAAEILDPKPKKNGKKKDKKAAAPHGEDPQDIPEESTEGVSEADSSSTQNEERRCRVCGCTEYDCSQCVAKTGSPCYWVEYDLCSACAPLGTEPFAEDQDNYPFEPDDDDKDPDMDMSLEGEDE